MNTNKVKIKAEYLTKKFELLPAKSSKNKAKSLIGSNSKNEKDFWALRNISFEIRDGECKSNWIKWCREIYTFQYH